MLLTDLNAVVKNTHHSSVSHHLFSQSNVMAMYNVFIGIRHHPISDSDSHPGLNPPKELKHYVAFIVRRIDAL